MRIAIVAPFASIALAATPADAQRRCTKGIPCGNTCISADRVCRIGASPAPGPRDAATAAPQTLLGTSTATARDSAAFGWVGSVDGTVYYRAICSVATRLWPEERAYFRLESDAVARGYRRSRVVQLLVPRGGVVHPQALMYQGLARPWSRGGRK